jgi:hypothetical protein
MEFFDEKTDTLLCRKKKYSSLRGGYDIMSIFVVSTDQGQSCQAIKFSLFNQEDRVFIYKGIFNKMPDLRFFSPAKLVSLTKKKLREMEFERTPFKKHLQSIQDCMSKFRNDPKPY